MRTILSKIARLYDGLFMLWVCALLMGVLAPRAAHAVGYQEELISDALARAGLELLIPESGARIEEIWIMGADVFTPADPWPDVFNVAHVQTRESVVRDELLFKEGAAFDDALEESARNLRSIGIFSIVEIVPVKDAEGRIGVFVFTRDLWSLRLEQGFQVTGRTVDRLLLQLSERNFLGRNVSMAVRFKLSPQIFSLGQRYFDRRVFSSRLLLFEEMDVQFSQEDKKPEGVSGSVGLGLPLFNYATPFSADVQSAFRFLPERQISGREVVAYEAPSGDRLQRAWFRKRFFGQARVKRQFSTAAFVHRLEGGIFLSLDDATPLSEITDLGDRQAFAEAVLPRVRDDVAPFIGYQMFSPRFMETQDLDSFGQVEAVSIGPAFRAQLSAGHERLLSSSDFVSMRVAAKVSAPLLGEGVVSFDVEGAARLQDESLIDRQLNLRTRLASPKLGVGRLVWRGDIELLTNDSQKRLVALGGSSGLRGYGSQAFFVFGGSVIKSNLEWRSPSVNWRSLQAGTVLFYDAGSVFETEDFRLSQLKQSVGVGIRFLIPQFNRQPYRLDLAFPTGGEQGFRVLFSFGDVPLVQHGKASTPFLFPTPL